MLTCCPCIRSVYRSSLQTAEMACDGVPATVVAIKECRVTATEISSVSLPPFFPFLMAVLTGGVGCVCVCVCVGGCCAGLCPAG